MGDDGDLVAARMARGCLCFGAFDGGALVGYGWLSRGPEWIGELEVEIKPREREAYVWNCVTLPEHRRRGVFRAVVAAASSEARRLGARRTWIGSVDIPAEKALAPLGFRAALRLDVLSLAGVRVMRVRRGPDPRLAADAAAVLGVSPGLVLRGSHPRRH